jgi:transposase InsO family protein
MYQLRRNRRKIIYRDRRRMAFKVMRIRLRAVKDYLARARSIGEAEASHQSAERFDISQSTLRRWARCYREHGKSGLLPQYRLPQKRHSVPFELVEIILALRLKLGWCGQRIAAELEQRQIAQLSHMSIYRIFKRYHVPVRTYHPVGRRDGIRYRKQCIRGPNWVWHIDFAGSWEDSQGKEQSILVVIDAYSRMLLALEVTQYQSSEAVESVLERLFERYGKPKRIITDNGRAFAPSKPQWGHRFPRFLHQRGIEHRRSAPFYPQTNGKAEAMIKTIEREFFALMSGWSWQEVERGRKYFIDWYNFFRPHGALDYQVPALRYAGVRLIRSGIKHLFGWLDMSPTDLQAIPQINHNNRSQRLALCLVNQSFQ